MAALIGLVSQKGGVGKSTLARLIAREYAAAGWQVKIADLDISQGTSTDWKQRRERGGIKPDIAVEPFGTVAQALKVAQLYDLVVFDGPPHSMAGTLGDCQGQRRGYPADRSQSGRSQTISVARPRTDQEPHTGGALDICALPSWEIGKTRSPKRARTSRGRGIGCWKAKCQREPATGARAIRVGRPPKPHIQVYVRARNVSRKA